MSDLLSERRLRRQRAHDVASFLGAMHIDGLDVDPEALAIAQRYDGELSIAKLRAAISSEVRQFRTKTKYSNG